MFVFYVTNGGEYVCTPDMFLRAPMVGEQVSLDIHKGQQPLVTYNVIRVVHIYGCIRFEIEITRSL